MQIMNENVQVLTSDVLLLVSLKLFQNFSYLELKNDIILGNYPTENYNLMNGEYHKQPNPLKNFCGLYYFYWLTISHSVYWYHLPEA
jgi:hypothetical protein